eukprot:scaffold108910_cov35-Tisochrysis_lutea.AAC.3
MTNQKYGTRARQETQKRTCIFLGAKCDILLSSPPLSPIPTPADASVESRPHCNVAGLSGWEPPEEKTKLLRGRRNLAHTRQPADAATISVAMLHQMSTTGRQPGFVMKRSRGLETVEH